MTAHKTTCCQTHDGAHLHGCIRPRTSAGATHLGACILPESDVTPEQPAAGLGSCETRQAAEAFVTRCVGEYAPEHDVPAIADALYDLAGSWDVRQVDAEDFWSLVRAHALDAAGQEASDPQDVDGITSVGCQSR